MILGLLRFLGALLLMVAITAVLLESTLRIAQWAGLFTSQPRVTTRASFYRDENPAFGVWHPPNASYRATTECFDVLYRSNDYGARDRERSRRAAAAPRVVVLGDSFVEGVGVDMGLRMTDVLESRTGIEHLNFGTAGNFSSIQEWRLYETLASEFDHDAVYLFMFPNNDFVENDPDRFWQKHRYRPYLRPAGDSFDIYFPIDLEESRRQTDRQLVWNRLYNAFYIYRAGAYVGAQVQARLAQGSHGRYGYIGYEQFDREDIERLLFTYRKLRDSADGRPLVIFTIPRLNELKYFAGESYPARLPSLLADFAKKEPGIEYFDLLPGFLEHWQAEGRRFADYFLPCDGHWSVLGNAVAADTVLRAIGTLPEGDLLSGRQRSVRWNAIDSTGVSASTTSGPAHSSGRSD